MVRVAATTMFSDLTTELVMFSLNICPPSASLSISFVSRRYLSELIQTDAFFLELFFECGLFQELVDLPFYSHAKRLFRLLFLDKDQSSSAVLWDLFFHLLSFCYLGKLFFRQLAHRFSLFSSFLRLLLGQFDLLVEGYFMVILIGICVFPRFNNKIFHLSQSE